MRGCACGDGARAYDFVTGNVGAAKMDIKEFVKTSLVQIAEGVAESIEEAKNHRGTRINPTSAHMPAARQHVQFDIAVTVQEGVSAKGSGGVTIATIFR